MHVMTRRITLAFAAAGLALGSLSLAAYGLAHAPRAEKGEYETLIDPIAFSRVAVPEWLLLETELDPSKVAYSIHGRQEKYSYHQASLSDHRGKWIVLAVSWIDNTCASPEMTKPACRNVERYLRDINAVLDAQGGTAIEFWLARANQADVSRGHSGGLSAFAFTDWFDRYFYLAWDAGKQDPHQRGVAIVKRWLDEMFDTPDGRKIKGEFLHHGGSAYFLPLVVLIDPQGRAVIPHPRSSHINRTSEASFVLAALDQLMHVRGDDGLDFSMREGKESFEKRMYDVALDTVTAWQLPESIASIAGVGTEEIDWNKEPVE